MQPDEQYSLKETSGSGGGLETGKSGPGAPRARNAPDEEYSLKKTGEGGGQLFNFWVLFEKRHVWIFRNAKQGGSPTRFFA